MTEFASTQRFQERSARWLLLLVLIHTLPVIWITPVVAGTAPTAALLAFGVASLFTFDSEGVALGLFVLLPALVYLAIGWVLAWLIARALRSVSRTIRAGLLLVLVIVPLVAVYFPIYVAGGHNSSSQATLFELLDGFVGPAFLGYWAGLHGLVVVLLAGQFLPPHSALMAVAARWTRPVIGAAAAVLVGVLVYAQFTAVVCRPLAGLGIDAAQLCVARAGGAEARYWYERAALDGNSEALLWVLDNTPNRNRRLEWLRRGAAAGDGAVQFRLAEHLKRYGDAAARAEAEAWLESSAAGGYGPAQFALAERLASALMRSAGTGSVDDYQALLEAAADNGSTAAARRLAEHQARGSFGYVIDPERAMRLFQEAGDASAAAKVRAEQAAIEAGDAAATVRAARRYLRSPLPGPGVQELGLSLFEHVAARDPAVRRELIVLLRTGSDGAPKDVETAARWLLEAARAGEPEAMDRVARNYMDGREGFSVDYPEARVWIDALLEHYRRSGDQDSPARIAELESRLKHFDRLAGMAGGELLGSAELQDLSQGTDAESRYRFALQLLAGQGSRRAEAVASLQQAAELGHGQAAWRLVQVYERGFSQEIDPAAARRELERATGLHHYEATRELASRYEYGKKGYDQDLDRAIAMYEAALAAGHDNRYGWNLDPEVFNHFRWLESRLRQARLKRDASVAQATP
ncbi:MAG: hypothetical protein RIC56_10130 [Pseudomonadales bacterium]